MDKINQKELERLLREVEIELGVNALLTAQLKGKHKALTKAKCEADRPTNHYPEGLQPFLTPWVNPEEITWEREKGAELSAEDFFNRFWSGEESIEFQVGVNKMVKK